VGSEAWRAAASQVNTLIRGLQGALLRTGRMVITADHGMVDAGQRIWWEDEPALHWGVRSLAGEPRMRHVYVEDDPEAVAMRWRDALGERAAVHTRAAAVASGLFGTVDPALVDRIGDVVVVLEPGTCVASRRVDGRVSALPGQHGGTSDRERRIPGLILDGYAAVL
jgi:Type I phosphodiesterase / nucleotide pyrophosphatase.